MKKKPEILYVDDEKMNRMLFSYTYSKHFEIHLADSGEEALKILKMKNEIELVLSDMKMPGMNGLEFIQIAKKIHPEKKFYLLTGFDVTPEIQSDLETGVIEKYFQKPLDRKIIEEELITSRNNQELEVA